MNIVICNKQAFTETFKWKLHKVRGIVPAARDGHAMCVCQESIYMFGGFEEEV